MHFCEYVKILISICFYNFLKSSLKIMLFESRVICVNLIIFYLFILCRVMKPNWFTNLSEETEFGRYSQNFLLVYINDEIFFMKKNAIKEWTIGNPRTRHTVQNSFQRCAFPMRTDEEIGSRWPFIQKIQSVIFFPPPR